ncbi:hypothetical protein XENOCAPTIV_012000 [Xenoophorus captivus]|uniref:Uncharacterized protein n=1 Tax=Xenoophorus captivus TaxID=1517983 RepID=A0ABV0QZY5_9TELE
MLVKATGPPSTASSSSTTSAAPGSPNISVEDLTSEAAADATNVSSDGSEGGVMAGHHTRTTGPTPDDVATSVLPGSIPKTSGSTPADVFQPQETFGPDRYQETEETVRNIGKLQERFSELEAHMVALEKQKVDRSELADLRQLNTYKAMLEDMILSLTSQLSSSFQDEAMQGENEMQDLPESTWRSALTSSSVNIGRKLSLLFQHYEQLQDTMNGLIQQQQQQQQGGGRAGRTEDREANRVRAADSQVNLS